METKKEVISVPSASGASMTTKFKDLTVSNLIEPWSGEGPVSVTEFFNKVDRAAKSGNWTDTDKVTVAVLKLTGVAALFLNSTEEALREDIPYLRFREIFIERFKVKHLDQFHYSALQNAVQYKNETPSQFADRCRRLCARTIRQVSDPEQQRIINEEGERRMLAAYINGLSGTVGTQVRYRMPSTLTEALQIATTVQEVDTMEARKTQVKFSNNGNNKIFAVCFNCNKVGHVARDCRLKRTGKTHSNMNSSNGNNRNYRINSEPSKRDVNQAIRRYGQQRGSNHSRVPHKQSDQNDLKRREVPQGIQCYACQRYGHYARDCKNKDNPKGWGSSGTSTGLSNQN